MKSFLYTKFKMDKLMKVLAIVGLSIFSSNAAFAQSSGGVASLASNDAFLWFILIAVVTLNLLALVLLVVVLKIQQILFAKDAVEQGAEAEPSLLKAWSTKLTDAVPIEKEGDVLLDHDYDGIQELDNNLPPWWKYLFYITIAFGIIYLAIYHVFDVVPLQEEEYNTQMAVAEAEVAEYLANMANAIDETNVTLLEDETRLASGQQIFIQNCKTCHAEDGGGGIGPNLTDNYWLHGGNIQDVFKTVKYGIPAKGMISWQKQLTPAQMQDVSSYILTLVGTTPANPKDPQGELFEPAGN